jgi:serine/threonine-protein kinase
MEHLNGHSLADRVARSGPMPWERACRITRLVADAASAAHQKGIIHRDLKPANVLILTDSEWPAPTEVKVLDFGLAKLLGIDVSGPTTGAGRVLGTPEYMSPEQCMGGKIDHRSDIYSLGCLLFQTIAGRPPFTADRILALLAAHKFKTPPSLASAPPGVPGWLDRLVTRMLAKLPDERPQTMIEVVAALTGNA